MPISSVLYAPFAPFVRGKMNIGLFILIAQLFIWISADWMFGQYAGIAKSTMLIYFIAYLLALVHAGNGKAVSGRNESMFNFVMGFAATAAIFLLIGSIGMISSFFKQATVEIAVGTFSITGIGFGFLWGGTKAWVEEVIFRKVLPVNLGFGDIISSGLFGIFHLAVLLGVYGLTPIQCIAPVLLLTSLGIMWSRVRNWIGIAGCAGSHFAYNLGVMNLLGVIFTGGFGLF